jgi:hypothetical protein
LTDILGERSLDQFIEIELREEFHRLPVHQSLSKPTVALM